MSAFIVKCFFTVLQIAAVVLIVLIGIGLARWTYRAIIAACQLSIWIFSLGLFGVGPVIPQWALWSHKKKKKKKNIPHPRIFDASLYAEWTPAEHEKARQYHASKTL